jgi:NAD(P)H-flavin reductase
MEELCGKDLLFVAGGIGLAPLRSVINFCLDRKGEYGSITLLYGSRSPSDIAFRADLDAWSAAGSVNLRLTVDVPEPGWNNGVGLVTTLLDNLEVNIPETRALLCGPPVMIDAVTENLIGMGFMPEGIITTMERNMKCGIGLCGHCHMGGALVCKDGPVFTVAELRQIEGTIV